eukprot:gene16394-22349_t
MSIMVENEDPLLSSYTNDSINQTHAKASTLANVDGKYHIIPSLLPSLEENNQ